MHFNIIFRLFDCATEFVIYNSKGQPCYIKYTHRWLDTLWGDEVSSVTLDYNGKPFFIDKKYNVDATVLFEVCKLRAMNPC